MSTDILQNVVVEFGVGASLAFLGGIVAYLRSISKSQNDMEKSYTSQLHALDTRVALNERSVQLFDEVVRLVVPTFIHSPKDPEWPRLKTSLMNNGLSYQDALKTKTILDMEIQKAASEGGKPEGMYYALLKYLVNKIIDGYERQQKEEGQKAPETH